MASLISQKPLKQAAVIVDGVKTDIVCCSYTDRHFVLITQLGKPGNVMQAHAYSTIEGGKVYEINSLLGLRDDTLLQVYARQLIEHISKVSTKPLLLFIALKEEGRSPSSLHAIISKILEIQDWGSELTA